MATTNLVILSSSPLRVYLPEESFRLSSSPSFPSPGVLLRKQTQVRSGSRAAAAQINAAPSFTISASVRETDIARHQRIIDSTRSFKTLLPVEDSLSVKKKKTDEEIPKKDVKEKKPGKARKKKFEMEPEQESVPQEKPARKARKKKDVCEGQTTIPKGKVTKASTDERIRKVSKKRQTATVSSYFGSVPSGSLDGVDSPSANTVLLREAVKRRTSWTPPKATQLPNNLFENTTLNESAGSDLSGDGSTRQKGFTDLLGSFGYTKEEETPVPIKSIAPISNRKRKLIELVKTQASAPSLQLTEKVKSIKKKPRTITERATAAYVIEDEDDVAPPAPPAPLLKYFSHKILDGPSESTTPTSFKKPAKPRSRSTAKSATKMSKSKKAATTVQPLFSPESALKQAHGQEFVFGTSSQLAREDSPTLLRDIQQAMLASNRIDEGSFADCEKVASESVRIRNKRNVPTTKKSLWSAAAWADDEHSVDIKLNGCEAEGALPVETSVFQYVSSQPPPIVSNLTTEDAAEWFEIDENLDVFELPAPPPSKFASNLEAPVGTKFLSNPEGPKTNCSDLRNVAKPSSATSVKLPDNSTLETMPDFKSYSTIRLAKEIASYHFKPIKSRDQMISLMERCWQGKQRTALGVLGPSSMPNRDPLRVTTESLRMASSQAGSPKKTRGRPRKISLASATSSNNLTKAKKPSTKSTQPVQDISPEKYEIPTPGQTLSKRSQRRRSTTGLDEISDSDSPSTPSPPRRSRSKVSSPPLPLELSAPDNVDDERDVTLSPGSEQLELHKHITKAILSAPMSTDPNNPSWHEKILMYDPIVLEDLTTWLNTGGLQKVGWDGEVSPAEVKKWCWKRSICCLWKVNLRGVARSRW